MARGTRTAGGRSGSPVRLAIVGAGFRGRHVYGEWCRRRPDRARVVAVADPDPVRRDGLGDDHGVPAARRYEDWQRLLEEPAGLDAVVVATPDRVHVEPTVAALAAGVDVLLEKPIAPDRDGLEAVRTAAAGSSARVTVAHVLRYTPFFRTVKRLVDDGAIGALTGIEQAENIGYWHFAHSYVRGNWRREDLAAPMILTKACHDLDVLRWLADARWSSVASFGGLTHFRRDQAPPDAPEWCLDGCPVEDTCPFHAGRYYLEQLAGWDGWPIPTITHDPSHEGRVAALRTGPYGRCVYRCDNDVVDHQVVICSFANGVTATLTVSGFTADNTRTIRLFGTGGELAGDLDQGRLEVRRFDPAATAGDSIGSSREVLHVAPSAATGPTGQAPDTLAGHAGGDDALMDAFVADLAQESDRGAPSLPTLLADSLDGHLMALAAERSRHTGQVVGADELTVAPVSRGDATRRG